MINVNIRSSLFQKENGSIFAYYSHMLPGYKVHGANSLVQNSKSIGLITC